MTITLSIIEISHLEKILNCKHFSAIQITKKQHQWVIELREQGGKYRFSNFSLEQVIKEVSLFVSGSNQGDEP